MKTKHNIKKITEFYDNLWSEEKKEIYVLVGGMIKYASIQRYLTF